MLGSYNYFEAGDGHATINNYDTGVGNADVLNFGVGISASDLTLLRTDDDLIIQFNDTDDAVTVEGYFMNNGVSDYALSAITFDDGTRWSLSDVTQLATVTQDNALSESGVANEFSPELALLQLTQAYAGFDGSSDESSVGKTHHNNVALLSAAENYY
jgi:hypothetical protein